jgi:hypothetical protein
MLYALCDHSSRQGGPQVAPLLIPDSIQQK